MIDKIIVGCLSLMLVPIGFTANLTSLKVKDDIVYFTTDEQRTNVPSCMATDNASSWTVSLNTPTGNAIYALLVTASADKRQVTVEGAEDCGDVIGYERAASVELMQGNASNGNSQSYYLYKADGVTKVGEIYQVIDFENLLYVPTSSPQGSQVVQYTQDPGTSELYFATSGCRGTAFAGLPNITGRHKDINDGAFFKSSEEIARTGVYSRLLGSGKCSNFSSSAMKAYSLDFSYEDPLCGSNVCVIKKG
ncbi:hypothetical protein [Thalassotalea ganghwensis]